MAGPSWALFLNLALATHALAQLGAPVQASFSVPDSPLSEAHVSSRSRKVLEPDVQDFVRDAMKEANVQGMAIAVVHSDWDEESQLGLEESDTEYGSFGIKSEEGDAMTSDVSSAATSVDL